MVTQIFVTSNMKETCKPPPFGESTQGEGNTTDTCKLLSGRIFYIPLHKKFKYKACMCLLFICTDLVTFRSSIILFIFTTNDRILSICYPSDLLSVLLVINITCCFISSPHVQTAAGQEQGEDYQQATGQERN